MTYQSRTTQAKQEQKILTVMASILLILTIAFTVYIFPDAIDRTVEFNTGILDKNLTEQERAEIVAVHREVKK